ncbi:hypothetical protein [Brevundimonas pishanensis]|jgi:hypothetical protein|uniref:hypothetical protein n=1 Tax=Brevundimonas pishanensis TaxID=2896315 RepID=UPI001FA6D13F|nr:hypothetical protein [Brevundimonas pishanensis]
MEIDGSNPKLRYIEIEEFTALIRLVANGTGWALCVSNAVESSRILQLRKQEVLSLCLRLNRKSGLSLIVSDQQIPVTMDDVVFVGYRAAKGLAKINNRSLTAPEVCTLLGISNTERLSLTKSGYLRPSGKQEIGRSGSVKSDLYRIQDVEKYRHPEKRDV